MVLQRLALFFFACSLTLADDYALSSYCQKSKNETFGYPPAPDVCCAPDYKCEMFIPPKESGFRLTNPDLEYSIRECDCDVRMRMCLRATVVDTNDNRKAAEVMDKVQCFYKTRRRIYYRKTRVRAYDVISLADYISSKL